MNSPWALVLATKLQTTAQKKAKLTTLPLIESAHPHHVFGHQVFQLEGPEVPRRLTKGSCLRWGNGVEPTRRNSINRDDPPDGLHALQRIVVRTVARGNHEQFGALAHHLLDGGNRVLARAN